MWRGQRKEMEKRPKCNIVRNIYLAKMMCILSFRGNWMESRLESCRQNIRTKFSLRLTILLLFVIWRGVWGVPTWTSTTHTHTQTHTHTSKIRNACRIKSNVCHVRVFFIARFRLTNTNRNWEWNFFARNFVPSDNSSFWIVRTLCVCVGNVCMWHCG